MGSEQIRLFGTDGIRGKAGEYPLDDVTIRIIGHSLAAHLAKELGHRPAVVIGRDTRESGARIEQALAFGMASAGADVESAGVITTPGVAYLARSMRFDAGAVISASHNPYQDNGIKVFTQTGKKIPDAWERRIEEDVPVMRRSVYSSYAKSPTAESDTGQTSFVVKANPSYCERYVEYLVKEVAAGLDLHGVRMVIDVANGAASRIAGRVFLALGAEVEILHAQPDGQNINEGCGSLHPENLIEAVKRGRADIGVAFDGDADRALLV
ncbi:MAG TPA: phosphoglucosamine mutase, partial [Blastocatellia bacterium]|nr:phosphoglucosamine mutase [Blastocatellia bacterium]